MDKMVKRLTKIKEYMDIVSERNELIFLWNTKNIIALRVMAKYRHNNKPEEEYIDLVPILENLYIDKDKFLQPITKVRVSYD